MATTSVDQVTGYGETVAYKAPCRLATSADKVLSGLQIIDTVQLAAGDRVLVMAQADATQNGIYIAAAGAWQRARDMDSNRDLTCGTRLTVIEGATKAGREFYVSTANPITVGTTSLAFTETLSSNAGGSAAASAASAAAALASQGAAATSASNAATSASAASTSASGAATSATNAATSATTATTQASAAATSATNANNNATAAAGSATTASTAATNAGNSATAAAASAASINLPSISAADADKRLFVNAAGTGYDKVYVGNIGYPQRFGTYDRTGVAASAAAINSALSSYKFVELGEGTFNLAGTTILYPSSNRKLIGEGKKKTILRPTSTNLPAVNIPDGLVYCDLLGVTIDRNAVAVAGGDGVLVGQTNLTNIKDIECLNNWIGLNLGPVGYGQVEDFFIHDNYSHGILMSNNAALGTLQWYVQRGLSQANDGWGMLVASANLGPANCLMGDWDMIRTFANTAGGVGFAGLAAVPILGVRLRNSFIGADGIGNEVFLDTYGGLHIIENVFAESGSQVNTGRGYGTAPAGAANGFRVTANNTDVVLNSCKALSNKGNGFNVAATGFNLINGGYSKGNTLFGVLAADGAKTRVANLDIETNTAGTISVTSNATAIKVEGCYPDSVNTNGQRTGTATNDNAAAGNVGEYVESVVTSGSPVSLVTATAKDVTTISLTAGDWDVEFIPEFTGGATTTVNYLVGSVSSGATNTLDQTNGRFVAHNFSAGTLFNAVPGGLFGFAGITVRFSLSATTTIRAVAQASFGTSTCSAFGILRARRVR